MRFTRAFTLAEALITLAVIGIVAALTIPGIIKKHNEKTWNIAKDIFEKKLIETTRRMNIDGVMSGHNTTESFMNEFKKYNKIIKICNNTEINKCYSPKVIVTGASNNLTEVDTAKITTTKNLKLDWNTNTMAYVIADGTTVIMAYNPQCAYIDPYSEAGNAGHLDCLGIIVDINGKKPPNQVQKDIKLLNGVGLSDCDNTLGELCMSAEFAPTYINTCDGTSEWDKDYTSDIDNGCTTNYWAGAKKKCAEQGMHLATREELATLASLIYLKGDGSPIKINAGDSYADIGAVTVNPLYSNNSIIKTDNQCYRSSQQGSGSSSSYGVNFAYSHLFRPTESDSSYVCWTTKNYSGYRAICFKNPKS